MDEYEPIWEGWKEPEDQEDAPWRLVIQPRSEQPSTEPSDESEAAKAELEELFRNAPGAYAGTTPDEES